MTKNFIRFIAGAVCPSCKALDKIAISADDQSIYCLSCSFKEDRPQLTLPKNLGNGAPKTFNLDGFRTKKS